MEEENTEEIIGETKEEIMGDMEKEKIREIIEETNEEIMGDMEEENTGEITGETNEEIMGDMEEENTEEIIGETKEEIMGDMEKEKIREIIEQTKEEAMGDMEEEIIGEIIGEKMEVISGEIIEEMKDEIIGEIHEMGQEIKREIAKEMITGEKAIIDGEESLDQQMCINNEESSSNISQCSDEQNTSSCENRVTDKNLDANDDGKSYNSEITDQTPEVTCEIASDNINKRTTEMSCNNTNVKPASPISNFVTVEVTNVKNKQQMSNMLHNDDDIKEEVIESVKERKITPIIASTQVTVKSQDFVELKIITGVNGLKPPAGHRRMTLKQRIIKSFKKLLCCSASTKD
jgi:hypothetical protein